MSKERDDEEASKNDNKLSTISINSVLIIIQQINPKKFIFV